MNSNDKLFRALHAGPDLLILPNAWDAGSARVIEHAGAKAIATSSAAVGWAHGYPDGQLLPFETLLSTLDEIVRIVRIPVSADIESGYAATAAEIEKTIARVVGVGVVGINIEDGTSPPDLLCAKIERAKTVAARAGVDLWVNARVDVFIRKQATGEAAFDETVRRAALYREAGADSIFVPALVDGEMIARMVPRVGLPFNALAWPGLPDAARLASIGVRRLSAGGGIAKASVNLALALAKAFLVDGRVEALNDPPAMLTNINELMRRD
jgi:2-methylisocitrate lyase-like PEP mutase family enzyme